MGVTLRILRCDHKHIAAWCGHCNWPVPVTEFRFHPTRKWKFDWAWPTEKVALELEGGTWTKGRHTRGAGYARDCEKYSEAALLGWRVLRCTTEQFRAGVWVDWLRRALRPQSEGEANGMVELPKSVERRGTGKSRRAKRGDVSETGYGGYSG